MSRFNFIDIALSDSADATTIDENFEKIEENAVLKTDTVTTSSAGLMSASDKTKLNGIATGANKTTIDSALSSSSTNPVQNKVINTALGNKVDKVDGKELSSNDYTTTEKNKLAGIATGANKTTVDSALSSSSTNPVQNKVINTALGNKVDKVAGKGLSTNDYTTAEKNKLAGLANVASSGSYNDLTNIPIYNGGNISVVDGSNNINNLTVGRTYYIGGLTVNGVSDDKFNNAIVRIYSSDYGLAISLLESNNMSQQGYIYYCYWYRNNVWQLASSNLSDKVSKSGDTMTGKLITPQLQTGSGHTGASNLTNGQAIIGNNHTVNGNTMYSSLIGGYRNTCKNAQASYAMGWDAVVGGDNPGGSADVAYTAFAMGRNVTARNMQMVIGSYNRETDAASSVGDKTGNAFIIGNGSYLQPDSNAFRVSYAGKAYGLSSYSSSGADYSELIEWMDGNPNSEDRVGRFVCVENNKMRYAKSDDVRSRIGIISAEPSVIGNSYSEEWKGKYRKDIFGRKISEIIHVNEIRDENDVIIQPEADINTWALSDEYDATKEYIAREDRKEFDYFAMLGQLIVVDDGTCEVDGYCYPNDNGIATKELDINKGFYVMERLDSTHIRVLLK